jgi:hypothetical protein
MYPRLAFFAAVTALFGAATADLSIISPGGSDLWWVANSENNIVWTCDSSPYTNFTILVTNSNPSVFSGPIAIVAIENNYDCSKTITQEQANQPVGTGYMIQLASPFNETDVYAQSQPFEIKALGSEYPASSATPTESATQTASASSGSASSSSTSTSSSTHTGAASYNSKLSSAGLGIAAIAALFGFMA